MNNRYKILIKGKNPDYFVTLLLQKHILIYHLEKTSLGTILVVSDTDYQKILDIKTSYEIVVLNRYGFVKMQYLFHKYFIFLLGIVFFLLVNVILSKVIFSVEVVHSNQMIRDLIYSDLEEFGIKKYHFKVGYQKKEEIVEAILKKETEHIEWLEIEEVGTRYVIRVEQRKKNKEEKNCKPRSIVAKKDAMILDIVAEQGEVVTKKFDYVKKGDVLISGLIYNKEEIVSKKCAIGKVFGEVWYRINLEIPKHYYEEKVTGKKKSQVEIYFLNKTYHLFHHYQTYQKVERPIIKSQLFPAGITFSTYLETEVYEENYDISTVDKKAMELAAEKLSHRLSKEDEIISKKVLKKYEKESRIIVDVFVKVKEDITDIISIEDVNIEDENNSNKE